MKTEDLIREYIRTHGKAEDKSKRAELDKPVKPVIAVTPKRS